MQKRRPLPQNRLKSLFPDDMVAPVMKMIAMQARKITTLFIGKGIIAEKDREVYNYCFDLLIASVIHLLGMTAIALWSGTVIPTACFFTAFRVMRHCAGGYHAKTEASCLMMTLGVYTMFLAVMNILPASMLGKTALIIGTVSTVMVFRYAPIGCPNKPIEGSEEEHLKKKSRITILILTGSIVILEMVFHQSMLAFPISYGTGAATLSLAAGRRSLRVTSRRKRVGEQGEPINNNY